MKKIIRLNSAYRHIQIKLNIHLYVICGPCQYGPVTYYRIALTDRYRIKQILSGGEKASTAENLEIFPLVNEHVPNMHLMCNG